MVEADPGPRKVWLANPALVFGRAVSVAVLFRTAISAGAVTTIVGHVFFARVFAIIRHFREISNHCWGRRNALV